MLIIENFKDKIVLPLLVTMLCGFGGIAYTMHNSNIEQSYKISQLEKENTSLKEDIEILKDHAITTSRMIDTNNKNIEVLTIKTNEQTRHLLSIVEELKEAVLSKERRKTIYCSDNLDSIIVREDGEIPDCTTIEIGESWGKANITLDNQLAKELANTIYELLGQQKIG